MNAQELREKLKTAENKVELFKSDDLQIEYSELIDIAKESLSDKEKDDVLFHYKFKFDNELTKKMICTIKDDNLKYKLLCTDLYGGNFDIHDIIDVVNSFSSEAKKELLQDKEFLNRKLGSQNRKYIVKNLDSKTKLEWLTDKELMDNLHLPNEDVAELINTVAGDDEKKMELLSQYELQGNLTIDLVETLSDENKIKYLKENKKIPGYVKDGIIKKIGTEELCKFVKEDKEYFKENKIKLTSILDANAPGKQMDIVEHIEDMDLTLGEKKMLLCSLSDEAKPFIDTSEFPEEYKNAMTMSVDELYKTVNIDFSRDMKEYEGMDDIIRFNPQYLNEEEKKKYMELCDVCPNMTVLSTFEKGDLSRHESSVEDYKEANKWMDEVLASIKPEHTPVQKLAIIDHAIGKKISYTPDFGTEVTDEDKCRAMYKIVNEGYGVCNGLSHLEKYMLEKVGIESEAISSGRHSYLKIKDIELPTADGGTKRGDTIVDPTWNLMEQRFDCRPPNFCVDYDTIRAHDVVEDGTDQKVHLNDDAFKNGTISLDDKSLREVYKSVGLAKENGTFPISDVMDESAALHEQYKDDPEMDIKKQFELLARTCPEFATCQNSTTGMLKAVFLKSDNLDFNKCVVNRVYDKEDKEKSAVSYVYIDSDDIGKKFYYADKEEGQFVELPEEEFTSRFECYERDLEARNGIRPWEQKEKEEEVVDLATSSGGKVVEQEDKQL